MRLVVTGSAGHLARVLVPRLLREPGVEHITGIDHAAHDYPSPRYRAVIADVRDPGVAAYLDGADALIHMAFVLMGGRLGRARHRRETVREVNVEGSRNVFAAAAHAGVSRLVFVSSASVYGAWPDNPPLMDETQPLRAMPGFAYAEDKVAVERWLDGFEAEHPATTVIRLRPHVILGPHAHPLLKALLRQPFYPRLPRPALTQCVWEDDVAEAILLATRGGSAGAYNLAADGAMSFRDMIRLGHRHALPLPLGLASLAHRLAWWLLPEVGEPGWVQGMQHDLAVDATRARARLGWRPRHDCAECVLQIAGPRHV
ncbi:MAG TPA: NAD-dependent epimerase/dehydratase family protein [Phycisphaerales bacterium]|nr:NAD-dependent epimerase/dehydratase family protein [Phycisphaerales bacterium]